MMLNSIPSVGQSSSSQAISAPTGPAEQGAFGKIIEGALEKISQPQMEANQAVQNLALGRTDNLHQVLLSVAKADLTFRMVLEIRNRLTEAMQEIMRMQV
jgi:flagellar hook-basal body complex protein FliE